MPKGSTGDRPQSLFDAEAERVLRSKAPLAERMRPTALDELVGQEHLLGAGRPLRSLIESDRLGSVILWGPPGSGKTTLARLIATATERAFLPMSAVTAGVKDVRDAVTSARELLGQAGRGTILFLDEVHRFNKAQQDALLPSVEDGTLTLIGATTENPFFSVNSPLLSRSTLFRLDAIGSEELAELVNRGLAHEGATATTEAVSRLVDLVNGDARAALTSLEVAIAVSGGGEVTLEDVDAARSIRSIRYEQDDHYDIVSAFIKSIRGSNPDAGLYWMARMLAGGEDPRFVARRLVILASEDVGMADPMSVVVAGACASAVELVGMPEAQLNLAQAVVHLALAPKSNSVASAIWGAQSDVSDHPPAPVPPHLRDSSYRSASRIGHGTGYAYPHESDQGWVSQQYLPDELEATTYYRPRRNGREEAMSEAWMARTGREWPDTTGDAADEEGVQREPREGRGPGRAT